MENSDNDDRKIQQQQQQKKTVLQHGKETSGLMAASLALITVLALPMPSTTTNSNNIALAYDPQDYASETVQAAIKSLKVAEGDAQQTFQAYENIAEIVAEGKGVGGEINYQGVQLERGYVADEDTSIYNPGLTLLTESEKDRLVNALVDSQKAGLKAGAKQWNENNQIAYEQLKERLDPFHMVELQGYLKIVPIYGAVLYIAVTAVQQVARGLFPTAYIAAAVAFFLPIVGLVLAGP